MRKKSGGVVHPPAGVDYSEKIIHMNIIRQEPATIQERFQLKLRRAGGVLPTKQVVDFVIKEEMRAQEVIASGHKRKRVDLRRECGEFYELLLQQENAAAIGAQLQAHFGTMPTILRLGMQEAKRWEKKKSNAFEKPATVSDEAARKRDILVDYIFRHDCEKQVSVTAAVNGKIETQGLRFPADIREDNSAAAKGVLAQCVDTAMQHGGGMVIRFIGIGVDGKDVLNGFSIGGDQIEKMSAAELRDIYERNPDGSSERARKTEYQSAFVSLD